MSPNPVQLRARGARDPRGGVGMIWNAAQMNFFHLSIRNRLPHKRSAKSSRFRSSRLRIKKERKMTCCGAVGAGEMLPGAIRGASDADRTHAGAGAGGGTRETTPPALRRKTALNVPLISRRSMVSTQHNSHL